MATEVKTNEKTKKPFVSVIVRTKDRPVLLKAALESIIAQTFTDFEIIVVNDGGTDIELFVRELTEGFKLQYIHNDQSMGRASAANQGLQVAKGRCINFLDDDDVLYPDHLKILTEALMASDEKVVYSGAKTVYYEVNEDHSVCTKRSEEVIFNLPFDPDLLLFENYIPIMTVLFAANTLKRVESFCKALTLFEDWDFWIRMSRVYPFMHVDRITAEYRVYNVSSITASHQQKYAYDAAQAELFTRTIPFLSGKAWLAFLKKGLVGRLRTDVVKLEKRITNLVANNTGLEKHVDELVQITDEYTHQIASKSADIERLEASLTHYKKTVAFDQTHIEELKTVIHHFTELARKTENDHKYIQQLETISQDKTREIENHLKHIQELNHEVRNYQNVLEIKQNEIASHETHLAELNQIIENYKGIEKKVLNDQQYITALEEIIRNFKALVTSKDEALDEKASQISALTEQANTLEHQKQENHQTIKALQENITLLTHENGELKAVLERIQQHPAYRLYKKVNFF